MPINPAAVAAIMPDNLHAAILVIVEDNENGEPVAMAHRLDVGDGPISTLTGVQILNSIIEPMLEEAADEMDALMQLVDDNQNEHAASSE